MTTKVLAINAFGLVSETTVFDPITTTVISASGILTLAPGINLFLCNVSSIVLSLTLPSSSPAGAIALFADATAGATNPSGFGLRNVMLIPNAGQNIQGLSGNLILDADSETVALVLNGNRWTIVWATPSSLGGNSLTQRKVASMISLRA